MLKNCVLDRHGALGSGLEQMVKEAIITSRKPPYEDEFCALMSDLAIYRLLRKQGLARTWLLRG